ncbi:hypothetical protein [Halopseudomonas xiamenensis]|uniref:hypothetical protein n=1 Tax=Halopseudomonas xiamenensis TaxID=157792 RepID=UPI0016255B3B|nr:hypothetical protein [Halopseudomonas xiamenensis]
MSTLNNRRHPMTPNMIEPVPFDESANFDVVPCDPQIVGRIEHHLEGEPVRVVLTAAGLSLPNGALLYAAPEGIDSEGGSHD